MRRSHLGLDVRPAQPSVAVVPGPGNGAVLTTVESGRAIVWLIGQIDSALAEELGEIGFRLPMVAPHVVVEPSRMTVYDATLADFLQVLTAHSTVTMRRPSLLLRQMLEQWGLADSVQIADFPGPAPVVPA